MYTWFGQKMVSWKNGNGETVRDSDTSDIRGLGRSGFSWTRKSNDRRGRNLGPYRNTLSGTYHRYSCWFGCFFADTWNNRFGDCLGIVDGTRMGWTLCLILTIISLILSLPSVLLGVNVIGIVIDIIILYYLTRPHVKSFYGKGPVLEAPPPPPP